MTHPSANSRVCYSLSAVGQSGAKVTTNNEGAVYDPCTSSMFAGSGKSVVSRKK